MKNQEYLSNPAMSNSKLNLFKRSPLHFKYFSEKKVEATKAQEFGKLAQLAVLQPVAFNEQFFALPDEDRRTYFGKCKAKQKMADNEGKTPLPHDVFEAINEIQKAVFSNKQAKKLLIGQYQKPFFWTDENTLIDCKARPEIYAKGKWIADFVTTTCADPDLFIYDVLKYGLHRKAAMQIDAVKESVPFYIIAAEKQAPYAVSVIKLPKFLIDKGRKEYKDLLKQYALCNQYDQWHGYESKTLDEKVLRARLKNYLAA